MVFTDPPYNVPIEGNVSGLGKVRHREFAMASGEMTRAEFTHFLSSAFANLAAHSHGWLDPFHLHGLAPHGRDAGGGAANYAELKNLIVWVKDNGGMGAFYRSRHELMFAFKKGAGDAHQQLRTRPARPLPNECVGVSGRQHFEARPGRGTGAASDSQTRGDDRRCNQGRLKARWYRPRSLRRLGLNPDRCSQDGRRARVCELDPVYCDRILRRWETFAKDDAELIACGFSSEASRAKILQFRGSGGATRPSRTPGVQSSCPTIERSNCSCQAKTWITRWGMASRLWPLNLNPDVQAIQGVGLEARATNCRRSAKNG